MGKKLYVGNLSYDMNDAGLSALLRRSAPWKVPR